MATLQLTCGSVALVDDDDIAAVNCWRWRTHPTEAGRLYVARSGGGKKHYLHRFLMGARRGQTVDHANGDPLDNRRANLRFCSPSQNAVNCRRPVGLSGFRGVYPRGSKWGARIEFEGRRELHGPFADIAEAASAYDRAALRLHGRFAVLNFRGDE